MALYSEDAWISEFNSLLGMFTLSIDDAEKLLDKADSSSLDLKTELAAPVIATLTSFCNLAT